MGKDKRARILWIKSLNEWLLHKPLMSWL